MSYFYIIITYDVQLYESKIRHIAIRHPKVVFPYDKISLRVLSFEF